MSMYLTREQSLKALRNMKTFNERLRTVYSEFGMNLESNLGRRNILLSSAQERFFADALRESFPQVRSDGHTGEPDIIIPELDKELECKLTTRYQSTGALAFQSDSMSFEGKENGLDFLYVVADEMFESFAVLHFIGLTRDDFHNESPGARGRVRMKKYKAMPKCQMIVGSAIDLREKRIEQYAQDLKDLITKQTNRIDELQRRHASCKAGTKLLQKTEALIEREKSRYLKRIGRIEANILKWRLKEPMYSISLENIGDKRCQNLICAA